MSSDGLRYAGHARHDSTVVRPNPRARSPASCAAADVRRAASGSSGDLRRAFFRSYRNGVPDEPIAQVDFYARSRPFNAQLFENYRSDGCGRRPARPRMPVSGRSLLRRDHAGPSPPAGPKLASFSQLKLGRLRGPLSRTLVRPRAGLEAAARLPCFFTSVTRWIDRQDTECLRLRRDRAVYGFEKSASTIAL